jgi:hypothetical protein
MRPKARRLAQHGGPPDWLEKSDPAECDFIRDGRSISPSMTDHTACPDLGLLSCERLAIPTASAAVLLLYEQTQETDMMEIIHGVPHHFSTNTYHLPGWHIVATMDERA